jgi:autotransporter-associated beta strand protein
MIPSTPSKKLAYSNSRYGVLATSLLTAMLAASSAQAADVVKAANTNALNLGTSWTGGTAPTSSDVAVWNNTVTAPNSSALGGDLSWEGIRIGTVAGTANPSSTTAGVQITNASSANTLTLGTAGIDMSAAAQALLIQSKIALSGNQTWNIANANTQNAPFAVSGINATLGEDLMFNAQVASTAMNLGGFTLGTSGAGSIGVTNGYAISNGVINLGNTNTWFQSGGGRATTLAGNVTVNVAANSNFRLRANSGGVASAAAIGVSGTGSKLQLEINNSGVTMAQSGALTLENGSTFENILTANGGMTVGAISATGNVAWNVNGSAVAMTNGVAVSGALTGNGTITYANTSTNDQVRLSGDNSGFTGTMSVNGGSGNRSLRLNTATAGSSAATWSVGTANTLQVNGVAVNLGTLNGAGTVTNSHASNVAALTVGSGSFSGAITNGTPAQGMSLTKNTGGTLSLSGSGNTFTGATSITGGKLVATQTGSLSTSSAISVNGSGAIFDGTGTFGAVTVADNLGTVQNGNGGSGALTVSSLTFNGDATLNVVTSSATPSARVVVTGALTTTPGSGTITVNGSGSWTNGVNNLLSYGSGGALLTDFTAGAFTGFTSRQSSGGLSLSGNTLFLTVNGDSPKWTGSDNGNWVVGTTGASGNWQLITAATQTDFIANDNVLFDDSSPGTKTVNVSSANVSVASAEFNTANAYTLTGGLGISAGTIAKNGSGALTIENANTTPGGVQLNAGTLNVNNNGALGSGALVIAAGTTLDNTSGSAKVASNAQNWNGNFTFTGTNDLTVGAAAMNASRDVTVNGGNLTVAGISGTGFGLTKSGAGTLAVGSSSYSGATVVNGGLLKATSTSSFTTTSSITLADTAGVALDLNGNSQTIGTITGGGSTGGDILLNGAVLTSGTASDNTFAGDLVGAGGLTKTGSGRLTLSGDKSGYTGVTTVNGGTLDLGTVSGNFGAAVTVTGGAANNSIIVGNGLFVQGNGLLNTGISGGGAGFGARGGNLTVNVGGSGGMINRNSGGTLGLGQMIFGSTTSDSRVIVQNEIGLNNFGGTRDITVNTGTGTASAEIAGVISGGTAGGVSGFVKLGAGDLVLSNANTYTGTTTINAGRVVIGHAQALQFSALNTDNAGRVTATGFSTPTIGGVTGAASLSTLINTGYTGITTLTINPQTGQSQTYSGVIADGAAGMNLVKSGAGTQIFNAAQTYTGSTTISGGTLTLGASGSLANSSAIINNATFDVSAVTGGFSVGAAQTLGGSGTVNGAVTVNGNLAPGTSPGVLTFSSPLTLAGTTTMEINGLTRGTEYDGINTGSGLLTYGGALSISFGSATSDGSSYQLFNIGGGGYTASFSSISIGGTYSISSSAPVGGVWTGTTSGFTFTFTEADGSLAITSAIPEPSSAAALAGLGALGLIATRRRRRA